MSSDADLTTLFEQLREPFTAESLFDYMPDMVFFIKNLEGRYVAVNQTLVQRCGKQRKSELLGCTPSQVLGQHLGGSYERQDQKVLTSGQQLLDQLELHIYPSRDVGWCLTNKMPLIGRQGEVLGLVGVSRDLKMPDLSSEDFEHISAAVRYGEAHIAEAPTNRQLADIACMSPYQLDRRMKLVFGMPMGQWLLKTRISRAGRQLVETRLPIVQVALDAGYKDQSAFTRQFRRATGMTPSQFRKLGVRAPAATGGAQFEDFFA